MKLIEMNTTHDESARLMVLNLKFDNGKSYHCLIPNGESIWNVGNRFESIAHELHRLHLLHDKERHAKLDKDILNIIQQANDNEESASIISHDKLVESMAKGGVILNMRNPKSLKDIKR